MRPAFLTLRASRKKAHVANSSSRVSVWLDARPILTAPLPRGTPSRMRSQQRPTPPDPEDVAKPWVRTHTPRPDELSRETFEFIAAIDEYKRKHMRSFLSDREVLGVLRSLGYGRRAPSAEPTEAELAEYAEARARYRTEHGRLFPTWSEVFQLLLELGYQREEPRSAA